MSMLPPATPQDPSFVENGKHEIVKEEPEPSQKKEPVDIQFPFKTLDAVQGVIEPWETYRADVADFDDQVAERMLDLMLNVRAWAEARPTFEDMEGEKAVRERLDGIEEREQAQEATRKKVMGFIDVVRNAIASLTGMSLAGV